MSKTRVREPELVPEDLIEEGRDLAADRRLLLPEGRGQQVQHGVRVLSPDGEENWRGLVYNEDVSLDDLRADLRLRDIMHEGPAYSIRHLATKKGKGTSAPEPMPDEAMGDFFIPDETFESWAEFAELSGFDFVLLDDLVSNPESWVELEEDTGA